MYRTWIYYQDGKPYAEVHNTDARSFLAEHAGWFLVDLANHVVLDRLGIYPLGYKLIHWANNRESLVVKIPLTKKEASAFPFFKDEHDV